MASLSDNTKVAPMTSGQIKLHELPEDLQKVLSVFDKDGDGDLDLHEIAEAGRSYVKTQNLAKMYKKAAFALFGLLCAYTAVLAGMIFAIVDANKDNENKGGAMVDRSTGKVVAVGTATTGKSGYEAHWELVGQPMKDLINVDALSYASETAPGAIEYAYVQGWSAFGDKSGRLLARFTNGKALVIENGKISKVIAPASHEADWTKLPLQVATAEQRRLGWSATGMAGFPNSSK